MERLFGALRLLLAPVRGALFVVVIVTAATGGKVTEVTGPRATVHS